MDNKKDFLKKCEKLLSAYRKKELGYMKMPEDENPGFLKDQQEERLVYFTLPMSLNYQRNSYTLWESVLKSWNNVDSKEIFSIEYSAKCEESKLRELLLGYKIALQPNKHINTWKKISSTIYREWGSVSQMLDDCNYDFLLLKEMVQKKHKKGFPYLSGPKIFHYWCYILGEYCEITLKNKEYIEIAPDTHVTKCSVKLGVITESEAQNISKEELSLKWRELLAGSKISPIDMHSPLWFWSRNNFEFKLD